MFSFCEKRQVQKGQQWIFSDGYTLSLLQLVDTQQPKCI